MANKRTRRSKRWSSRGLGDYSSCSCPSGSTRISTKGHGRGFVCQSNRKTRAKNGRMLKKFVKANCR